MAGASARSRSTELAVGFKALVRLWTQFSVTVLALMPRVNSIVSSTINTTTGGWDTPRERTGSHNKQPGINLTLRTLTWTDGGDASGETSRVEFNVSATHGDGHELQVLADFDSGAIRLWQGTRTGQPHHPLVPLGLCPGEHVVSAWAITPDGVPLASTKPTTFTINGSDSGDNWREAGACSTFERQPTLAGREGIGQGSFCRVCSRFLRAMPLADDTSESRTFPQTRARLLLRTSLMISVTGNSDALGQTTDREWAIELREGDSPASAAREFVRDRLGLRVPRDGTPSATLPKFATIEPSPTMPQREGEQFREGAEEREAERVVRRVMQRLEVELVERQERRSLQRAEAAQIAVRTGRLRIALGTNLGEPNLPSDADWLTTDVNTLDVTDPEDFAYLLEGAGDGLADAFLAEHVWEHLTLAEAHRAARNCHRYLRPGGRLRLAVPDPAWFTEATLPGDPSFRGEPAAAPSKTSNNDGSDIRCIFDEEYGRNVGGCFLPGKDNGMDFVERILVPRWLSVEMLVADARDGHLVQYTPELLANVCWSAGFSPVLLEGGEETERPNTEKARNAVLDDNNRQEEGSTTEPAAKVNAQRLASGDNERRWGRIKRSLAGGDPRGAVSIVMDCVKAEGDEQQRLDAVHSIVKSEVSSDPLEVSGRIGDTFVGGEKSKHLSSSSDPPALTGMSVRLKTTTNGLRRGLGAVSVIPETIDRYTVGASQGGGIGSSSSRLQTTNISMTSTHDARGGTAFGASATVNRSNSLLRHSGSIISDVPGSGGGGDEGLSTPWERTISDLDTFRPGSKLNDSHAVGTVEEDDQQRSIDRENDSAQQMGEGCCTYGDCRRGCAQRTSRTSVEMRSEGGLTCVDCLLQGGSDRNKALESDSFKRNMNNQTTTVLSDGPGLRTWLPPNAEGALGGAESSSTVTEGVPDARATGSEHTLFYQRAKAPTSFKAWAAAARTSGRVNISTESGYGPTSSVSPPAITESDITAGRLYRSLYETSAFQTAAAADDAQPEMQAGQPETSAQQRLVHARMMTREALLAGDSNTTLELCRKILEEYPTDGITLLYQGAAKAQIGEWNAAWEEMERVLALSRGVQHGTSSERDASSNRQDYREQAAAETREAVIPLDITLAAASNLASFARVRASDTLGSNAEIFFLVDALRFAAERDMIAAGEAGTAAATTGDGRGKVKYDDNIETLQTPDDEVARVGGFIDALAMAARSFEEKGQVTAALRLYQRAVLLGGHVDQRTLHGLGGVFRLILQAEKERLDKTFSSSSTRQTHMPEPKDGNRWVKTEDPEQGCQWSILHPRPGQVFSAEDAVPFDFDLTFLDPGLPLAGSLFETVGSIPSVNDGGLGVVVCSYLEGFEGANCMPNGKMWGVPLGWHVLTAEAYQLPSLSPFDCFGRDEGRRKHSTRTVRFCVGQTAICGGSTKDHSPAKIMPSDRSARHSTQSQRPTVNGEQEPAGTIFRPPPPPVEVELPFCFMTLALNAMPFIKHHGPVFRQAGEILASRAAIAEAAEIALVGNRANGTRNVSDTPPPEAFWEWHVVEGVAAGRADHRRPYSRRRIPDRYFDPLNGLSTDGTSQYLDDLVFQGNVESRPEHRQQIRLHRRCVGGAHQPIARGIQGGMYAGNQSETVSPKGESRRGSPPYGQQEADRPESVDKSDTGYMTEGKKACLWRDKIQMVNAVAFSLEKECLLVQIDADELWTATQLVNLRDMFLQERGVGGGDNDGGTQKSTNGNPFSHGGASPAASAALGASNPSTTGHSVAMQVPISKKEDGVEQRVKGNVDYNARAENQSTHRQEEEDMEGLQTGHARECAYFDCHFFVGWDLVTVTENGWGHSTEEEWLRAWVFRPLESVWLRHAPPELAKRREPDGWVVLRGNGCITKEETRRKGLVFTHLAYVLEEQVRFKSHYYGHSNTPRRAPSNDPRQRTANASADTLEKSADAVDEWRALQKVQPPVRLADHLTWLRVQGFREDPRLLETIADRPGVGARRKPERNSHTTEPRRASSIVTEPSEPLILRMFWPAAEEDITHEHSKDEGRRVYDHWRDDTGVNHKSRRPNLTHDVYTQTKGTQMEGRRKRTATKGGGLAVGACNLFHIVVDGVAFQVDASKPKGIFRVWASVLSAMMERLGKFEGTCLTLLVRGMAPLPAVIQAAFQGRPPERFSVTHVPLYSPTFGFVADRLMLSWFVRSTGATAFVSTMYTQPHWATTPNVVRLLLIHDLIPEVLGLDMSKGEWLEKANAVALASRIVTVSQYSAREFLRVYPPSIIPPDLTSSESADYPLEPSRPTWAAHNGVDINVFRPRVGAEGGDAHGSNENLREAFRLAAGLEPGIPYVLIVGSRLGYKNTRAAYRALGLADDSSSSTFALVLIGGGPLKPEELELLDEVQLWSHVGVGSAARATVTSSVASSSDSPSTAAREGAPIDDALLAAAYSGAVALLHMSIAEGFGLTVLEAFACGCPVVAVDIPPVREIAGLPDAETSAAGLIVTPSEGNRSTRTSVYQGRTSTPPPQDDTTTFDQGSADDAPLLPAPGQEPTPPSPYTTTFPGVTDSSPRETQQFGSVSPHLQGGLVLVENPRSATQIWRALRAVIAMDAKRRAEVSEALVRRARVFSSWQPLADTLVKAAVY